MQGPRIRHRCGRPAAIAALACAATATALAGAAPAPADVFNGRIAFSSVRSDPGSEKFDIFSMNADGSDVRRLTTSPRGDRQPDWSPDARAIAYTIDKPDAVVNFEIARMAADGRNRRQLTTTATGEASSQPSWLPHGGGILFRRSGPTSRVTTLWQMGLLGERPALRFAPPQTALYPTYSPDMARVAYAGILSPTGDTDRGIFTIEAGDGSVRSLFDAPGAYDSAPAWSPDGRQIAFESNADLGGNPEHDMEIWVMGADGAGPQQRTFNAEHDEGPAWSPDGRMLAYTSGPDQKHGDIVVMDAATGAPLRRLTGHPLADESPDWQAIPAPDTSARCGDAVRSGRGGRDVRRAGRGLTCAQARGLARRWVQAGMPRRVRGYVATSRDFGGVRRVQLRRGAGTAARLVAFLHQSKSTP
jgi:TolB protein